MLYEIRREFKAEPMSRLDYNTLRGWTLHKGVKVTDISSGHVSWLPYEEWYFMNKRQLPDN